MYRDRRTLEDIYHDIQRRFSADPSDINDDLKDWANELLFAIRQDRELVIRGDEGYKEHLLDFIQREVDKASARHVDEVPGDELRSDPLCTCEDIGCDLKRGRIPSAIGNAPSVDTGVREFKRDHTGSPEVLIDAREAWRDRRGRVGFVLRRIDTYMTQGREEPPETEPSEFEYPDGRHIVS